jgi:hypothetical protein
MTPEEKRELEELKAWKKSLEASSTIPLNIDQSFRTRFPKGSVFTVSTKGVDTEDVSVNEAGIAAYAVMNDPDGFLQVTVAGTIYYVPYFT